jgi:hypothetical protein
MPDVLATVIAAAGAVTDVPTTNVWPSAGLKSKPLLLTLVIVTASYTPDGSPIFMFCPTTKLVVLTTDAAVSPAFACEDNVVTTDDAGAVMVVDVAPTRS